MKGAVFNKVWRTLRRTADWARVCSSKLAGASPAEPFDGEARVALLCVSFNTRELSKLMLLTLADQPWAARLSRLVVVDNSSSDGSRQLLAELARASRVELVDNRGPTSHGYGLRLGTDYILQSEARLPRERRSNVLLVVDSDVVFLRADTLDAVTSALAAPRAGALGELQFDLGEPYAHPCCLFVRVDALADPRVWPFVDHGAPALWLQRSLRCAGRQVVDFPLRSEEHVVHRGRASIAAVNRLGLRDPYQNVRDDAHFHGNPRGAELWSQLETRHIGRLKTAGDPAFLAYVSERLGR